MNELEIKKLTEESEKITEIERAQVAEYAKLSYLEELARREGFANSLEYRNWHAQQKGFINSAKYNQVLRFKRGIGTGLSIAENKNSTQYLGIYIAERLLFNIFQDPIMMPHGTCGYDAICRNNYKIDVKSSVLLKNKRWYFNIKQNKVADAFLCIAFNNRVNLNVQHIWLIPGTDIIRKKQLNELKSLVIYNTDYSRTSVAKYELGDKLEQANNTCILFKTGFLR